MSGPIVGFVTALAMEPVAAAVHRWFGHGPGWVLHRDHHEPVRGWQRNDLIPVGFAAAAIVAFLVAVSTATFAWLFPVAAGVTAYGVAYALVHDVYIHRRIPLLPARVRWLEPWRRAHERHHEGGGRPFGVLIPLL